MKNNYNNLILRRVERHFDRIIQIGCIASFCSAIIIYTVNINRLFTFLNIIMGCVLLSISLLKKYVSDETKMYVTMIIPFIIGYTSFIDAGFESGGLLLLMISNALATLFLTRRRSLMIGGITILMYISLYFIGFILPTDTDVVQELSLWIIQFFILVIYLLVVNLMVYAVKDYLCQNIEELEDSIDKIYELAYFDPLTGLMNLNLFSIELKRKLASGDDGFLVVFNIQNLHLINSIYNDNIGDQVLVNVAHLLNEFDHNAIIARMSGSEFAVWLNHESEKSVVKWIDDFKKIFSIKFRIKNMTIKIEFHTVITKSKKGDSLDLLIRRTRLALTHAKSIDGVDNVFYTDSLEELVCKEELLKERVRLAVTEKSFICVYQGKHDVESHQLKGLETLARWNDSVLGQVPPDKFIPVIEKMGLAKVFGEVIINKVFSEYKAIRHKYKQDISIAINISPSHLLSGDFTNSVKALVVEYDIPTKYITFEITEEVFICNLEQVKEILNELVSLGFSISLDDFGSGYSSLKYLAYLNIQELKIDKSFIDKILVDSKVLRLVEMIVNLAKHYNLKVVAEGVEKEEQAELLKDLSCDLLQGYWLTYPTEL